MMGQPSWTWLVTDRFLKFPPRPFGPSGRGGRRWWHGLLTIRTRRRRPTSQLVQVWNLPGVYRPWDSFAAREHRTVERSTWDPCCAHRLAAHGKSSVSGKTSSVMWWPTEVRYLVLLRRKVQNIHTTWSQLTRFAWFEKNRSCSSFPSVDVSFPKYQMRRNDPKKKELPRWRPLFFSFSPAFGVAVWLCIYILYVIWSLGDRLP